MYLCLDAGNTRIKYGYHDGQRWLAQGVADNDLRQQALPAGFVPQHIIISNVAGPDAAARMRAWLGQWPAAQVEVLQASAARCGVRNSYAQPAQLGCDRWAALIGARQLAEGALLIVSAGTATTIDVLEADGLFAGGCILPGLDLMHRSLSQNTAGLPSTPGHFAPLARNTSDAITSGCLHAQLGAIARIQIERPAAQLILTGGAAPALLSHLPQAHHAPWLVLDGLLRLARQS